MKNKTKIWIHQTKLLGILFILSCSFNHDDRSIKSNETGSFTDSRDGKTYKTVKIGNQWIMAENLAYKPDHGNYWAYKNDSKNVIEYGYLYDWETAKQVAPKGWHLPTKKEWKTFRKSLGARIDTWTTMNKVYKQMVSKGSSGFNAKFGGAYVTSYGEFRSIGDVAYFWSSTDTGDGPVNYIVERESGEAYLSTFANPASGMSVRLFKD